MSPVNAAERAGHAAVVTVGDELLNGETVDTNAAWLGRRLADLGLPVVRRYTVGDVDEEIRGAVAAATEVAEVVLVSGGLGPTRDDRTKQAVAELYGRALVVDAGAERALRERYASAGHPDVPAASRGQAEIPSGATALLNAEGTAPGIVLEIDDTLVVLLPGVPRELRALFDGPVQGVLEPRIARGGTRLHHRVVHTTGIAESKLAEAVEKRLTELPGGLDPAMKLAWLPDVRGVDVRLTLATGSTDEANRRFDELLAHLGPVLDPWSFDADSGDIAAALSDELRRRSWTLAVAESCTGGLVAKRLTDLPGAGDVFRGGVVAYANQAKVDHLGVSPDDIERHGAVSEAVAAQLATGAADRFGAEVGIGVTGVAGPTGGSEDKPVGLVWIATAVEGVVSARSHRFPGGRESVRERAAQAALALTWRRLTASAED